MDFRNMNKFNVFFNALSANFFPLSEKKTKGGFISVIFVSLIWLVELIYLSSTTIGMVIYIPPIVAVQVGGVQTIVTIEMLILSIYLHSQHDFLRNMIAKINIVLVNSETLRQCIRRTVEPRMKFLKIYSIPAVASIIFWSGTPIFKLLSAEKFTYNDYTVPAYVPGSPIDAKTFACTMVVTIIGATYILLKKIGIDIYTTYMITLLTAEYRYIHLQVADALKQEGNNDSEEKSVVVALRKIVEHHSIVTEIGQMLTQLLSLNVGLIYLNCILRFCFLGFSLVTISGAYFQKFIYIVYSVGALSQVYSFCSCVQELLEASTSITKDAFHNNWYGRGSTVKRIFHTIGLSNYMECRLTAFRVVDLTIPSFSAVLNQAYSFCLLLIKIY